MANLHVIKRSHVNDVSVQVLYNEKLSWGVSQKSMPILAEIEDRKSQQGPGSSGKTPSRPATRCVLGPPGEKPTFEHWPHRAPGGCRVGWAGPPPGSTP